MFRNLSAGLITGQHFQCQLITDNLPEQHGAELNRAEQSNHPLLSIAKWLSEVFTDKSRLAAWRLDAWGPLLKIEPNEFYTALSINICDWAQWFILRTTT